MNQDQKIPVILTVKLKSACSLWSKKDLGYKKQLYFFPKESWEPEKKIYTSNNTLP